MDHFGIGQAIRGLALGYVNISRHTGRTTSLLESLRDGDRVVCVDSKQARVMQQKLAERGLKVTVLVVPPNRPDEIFQVGTSEGRTIFDHPWVEQYYLDTLAQANRAIDHLQRQTSGYGTAHLETRRRAEERFRWNGITGMDTFDGGDN